MLPGVIILDSYQYVSEYSAFKTGPFLLTCLAIFLGWIILIFAILIGLDGNFSSLKDSVVWFFTLFASSLMTIFIGALVSLGFQGDPIEYTTVYKVTTTDTVSMNDFTDMYEIIEVEGKIYTVKIREK